MQKINSLHYYDTTVNEIGRRERMGGKEEEI